jgi:hypothetical protein
VNRWCLAPLILALLVAGCGGAVAATTPAVHVRAPVLAAQAVPGLSGSRHAVAAPALARDAPVAGLAEDLDSWGFVGGEEADYRGNTPVFSVVTSRTLVFATPGGARSFVSLVGANASAYAGGAALSQPIASAGRRGFLLTAGACGCATELPQRLAVVSAGRRVTWLEATGRRATAAAVTKLLASAP